MFLFADVDAVATFVGLAVLAEAVLVGLAVLAGLAVFAGLFVEVLAGLLFDDVFGFAEPDVGFAEPVELLLEDVPPAGFVVVLLFDVFVLLFDASGLLPFCLGVRACILASSACVI